MIDDYPEEPPDDSPMPTKTCATCGLVLPLTNFKPSGAKKYMCRAKHCGKCLRAANPEKTKQYQAKSYAKRKEKTGFVYGIERLLHVKYGLSMEDYIEMNRLQNGVCAICQKPCNSHSRLSVDHCHETGMVRGLLCQKCNTGIGSFDEDQERLQKAAAYLSYHKKLMVV